MKYKGLSRNVWLYSEDSRNQHEDQITEVWTNHLFIVTESDFLLLIFISCHLIATQKTG